MIFTPSYFESFVGKPLSDLRAFACLHEYTVRLYHKNGIPCIVTRDMDMKRLNVDIDGDDIVTKINGFG